MTHYPDLGTASYWLCRVGNLIQPIRSTTQIWEVTCHQYGISALVSQMGNQYMVVLPNVSCYLRLPNECRTQRLTRIDFQISFNPDGQIDDGFLKGQSWNEITMTLNIYSRSWIYIGYNIPLSHTDQETATVPEFVMTLTAWPNRVGSHFKDENCYNKNCWLCLFAL